MIYAILSLGGMGLLFAMGLALASKVFAIKVDPKIEEAIEALPGSNCGACGYAGCKGYAEAVTTDPEVRANLCPAGGEEIAHLIGRITGKEVASAQRRHVLIKCAGSYDQVGRSFIYDGVLDCKAATLLFGGDKDCRYGCLGLGSCAYACPFGAIVAKENGLPEIDLRKCTGCGVCIKTCPKGVIALVPDGSFCHVLCSSKDKGVITKKICKVGCIGCRLCAKECENGAILVEDNIAVVLYDKCTGCGRCVEKCPTSALIRV
ncbi:TPA: hypothetical protein DCX15_00865 [bacterium]|nr:hypothetical protein [bacterium]